MSRMICLLAILIGACKTANRTEEKFALYPQQGRQPLVSKVSLVNRIHDQQLYIHYGFAPSCSKRKQKKLSPNLETAIKRAFDLWLAHLKQTKKTIDELNPDQSLPKSWQPIPHIVSKFKLKRRSTRKFTWNSADKKSSNTYYLVDTAIDRQDLLKRAKEINKIKDENERRKAHRELVNTLLERSASKPDATIVFYCQKDISYTDPLTRNIHLRYNHPQQKPPPSHHRIPKTEFSFPLLLHEIGHTFGLDDTYVASNAPSHFWPRDHLKSTGVSDVTIGKQVHSIMATHNWLNFTSYESISPTLDDYLGLEMMYRYVTGAIDSLEECPSFFYDYEAEHFAKGAVACRPKHPLIYATRFGQALVLDIILGDKKHRLNLEINAQDILGNTALHYAVINPFFAKGGNLVEILLAIYHQTISTTIKNHEGKTARDLAVEKGYQKIVEVIDRGPSQSSINRFFDLDQQVKRRQH